ncbi:hypothetical protein [Parvularcula oceani]|uniref:hypothetical protein n=1 Tax=Parvularcula oceani TaxID=1247963 RepID=UPI0004E1345D|nr:hypothetical protein [Parvularcula oceani]
MSEAHKTTDHDEIRKWAEERDGAPAAVADTLDSDRSGALLRICFRDEEDSLETIEWDRFFDIFEKNKLAALLQDDTKDGGTSRFVKFVDR